MLIDAMDVECGTMWQHFTHPLYMPDDLETNEDYNCVILHTPSPWGAVDWEQNRGSENENDDEVMLDEEETPTDDSSTEECLDVFLSARAAWPEQCPVPLGFAPDQEDDPSESESGHENDYDYENENEEEDDEDEEKEDNRIRLDYHFEVDQLDFDDSDDDSDAMELDSACSDVTDFDSDSDDIVQAPQYRCAGCMSRIQ